MLGLSAGVISSDLGYVQCVLQGSDHHDVYEAARILGLSPARVRQMLRSGELKGERVEGHAKGVPGPWKVRADSVRALRASQEDTQRGARRDMGEEAAETAALGKSFTNQANQAAAGEPGRDTGGTPSEAAELLSESVRRLMEKLEALRKELEQLEGRLEFSEIQEFALQESLRRERERAQRESERADALQAELDAQRSDRRGVEQRSPWQRLFRG